MSRPIKLQAGEARWEFLPVKPEVLGGEVTPPNRRSTYTIREAIDVIRGELHLYDLGKIPLCDALGSIKSMIPELERACGDEFARKDRSQS